MFRVDGASECFVSGLTEEQARVIKQELEKYCDSDCRHEWLKWTSYTSDKTWYADGLWHTVKTPRQRRECETCGVAQDRSLL